jgi:exopolysaccharide biosynthesis protein
VKARCWTIAAILLLTGALARAEFPTTRPHSQVTYVHRQRRDPDLSLYIVTVDLTDPDVKVHLATAGDDPDGPGPWQTTLMPVSAIARREGFDIAINASFFEVPQGPTSRPNYVEGNSASSVGWTMSDGKLLSPTSRPGWPIIWIDEDRRVRIDTLGRLPPGARQIITGNGLLVSHGKPLDRFEGNLTARHPRTAIGVDEAGRRLIILTLDGRRAGVSVGMTGIELAAELQRLGCWDAINLDGGGSTTLLMRDPATDELKLLNQPSDNRERPVSNALGVTVRRPTTRPAPAGDP